MNTYAEYSNGFGVVQLKKEIDVNNMSLEDLSIFVHEYIHFVQDSTTTFGLMYTDFVLNKVLATIEHAKNEYAPASVNYYNFENASEVETYYNMTFSHDKEKLFINYDRISIEDVSIEIDGDDLEIHELCLGDLSELRVPNIEIVVHTEKGEENLNTLFSAIDLMECYANLVEKNIYQDGNNEKILQYELAKEVAYVYNSQIANNKSFLAAACDASLMYENPGLVFCVVLNFMTKEKYEVSTVKDVYDYFDERIIPNYKEALSSNLEKLHETIDGLYDQQDIELSEMNRALKSQFDELEIISKDRSRFTEQLLSLKSQELVNYILSITSKTSHPICIHHNTFHTSGSNHTDLSSIIGLATLAMYSLFNFSDKKYCILYGLCKKNEVELIDNYCFENPLMKPVDDKLCHLHFLIYKWSIR